MSRILSLCTGYGGLDQAVEQVTGARTVAVSDIDPGANKILAHRYPDVPNLGDLKLIDWEAWAGTEIMTAGFPCQDVSTAGKRAGLSGSRTGVFFDIMRGVSIVKPQLVVFENVRGLLSGKDVGDEPNDTCVCGWPYRRGGLHRDLALEEAGRLRRDSDRGDDVESLGDSDGSSSDVFGIANQAAGRDGAVGRSVGMVRVGGFGGGGAGGDQPAPKAEIRTGPAGNETGGDTGNTDSPSGIRQDQVDAGSEGPLRSPEDADERAEREGAFDLATGERVFVCQACGRDVGDGSVRFVERHWMGTVLGALAEAGYDATWTCLKASDVGACHRRERLFIVATPRDAPRLGVEGDWPGRVGIASALAGPRLPDRSGDVAADPGKQRRDRGTGLTGEGWQTAFGGEEGSDAGNSDRSPLTLLPTPAVNDMGAGKTVDAWDAWTDRMQAEHGNGNGHGKSLEIEALRLLPTPRTSDRNGAGLHGDGGADLRTTVEHLLPTPRAAERMQRNSADSGVALSTAVTDQDWGLYTAAIARHGRATQTTAPSPTEPGAKGQPRLSPRFVEWMMMQRAGWVTDVPGLTRNEQLKALGNGVVTPQAATALRWLLTQARAAADALEVSDA